MDHHEERMMICSVAGPGFVAELNCEMHLFVWFQRNDISSHALLSEGD